MSHLLSPAPADPNVSPHSRSPRGLLRWAADKVGSLAPISRLGRILLLGPVLVAVLLLANFAYLGGASISAFWLSGYLYNVLPSLALAGLISLTSRRMALGMPALVVGTALYTAFNLDALIPMFVDDSSTGVLLYLFLPLYAGALVLLIGLVAWLVQVLRNRRAHRPEPQ